MKNVLKIGICTQTLAQVIQVSLFGSALGSFLFISLNFSEPASFAVERVLASLMVGLVSLLIIEKFPKGLILIGVYFFSESIMVWINGGKAQSELALFTHMARYLAPIALYALFNKQDKLGIFLLKLGIGSTFIFHGIKALQFNPLFIDYLMEGMEGLVGMEINESSAKQLLIVIGVVDIILGVLAFFKSPPWIYFYMALWGGVTAWFRFYFHGELGILPMFVRINHLLIPLYLGFYFKRPKVEALYV
jgi:uncharacterized membrane protein HdeD (DUF308 family)